MQNITIYTPAQKYNLKNFLVACKPEIHIKPKEGSSTGVTIQEYHKPLEIIGLKCTPSLLTILQNCFETRQQIAKIDLMLDDEEWRLYNCAIMQLRYESEQIITIIIHYSNCSIRKT